MTNMTDTLTTDTNEGTHYQTNHAYLYIPNSTGSSRSSATDDDGKLGAILRLGTYADIEKAAYDANSSTCGKFYPAQHLIDESSTAKYRNAGGTNNGKGILLACDGRILIRAGEKAYINSAGDMHIESGTALEIKASDSITVNAGEEGDIIEIAKNVTKEVGGTDYEHVEGNAYSWHEGNVVGIQEGSKTFITFGAACYGHIGTITNFAFSTNVALYVGLDVSIFLNAYFEWRTFFMPFTKFMFSIQLKQIQLNKAVVKAEDLKVRQAAAEIDNIHAAIELNDLCMKNIGCAVMNSNLSIEKNASRLDYIMGPTVICAAAVINI
jgi:hypothetical protein